MLSNIRHGFEHDAWFIARSIDTLCVTGLGCYYEFDTEHFEPGETLAAQYCLDAPEWMPAGSCISDDCPFVHGDVYTAQSYVTRPEWATVDHIKVAQEGGAT